MQQRIASVDISCLRCAHMVITCNELFITQVKYLSRLGGLNVQKIVHGILKRLFHQEISEQINLTGRNGKIAFKPMQLRQVVGKTFMCLN